MTLINSLIQSGYLKTSEIIRAFEKIKRKDFLLPEYRNEAEIDAPLSIEHGQTISQPSTVAFMLELLQPKTGDKILDVGSVGLDNGIACRNRWQAGKSIWY